MILSKVYKEFINSEKIGGLILIFCTIISMILSNSFYQTEYLKIWQINILGHNFLFWINEGLMGFFFLLIGLELERELYEGELRNIRNALLPIFAAIGGMIVPASIYLLFNFGKSSQSGAGIPMATDIAFALGILSLLGKRVPNSLKIFLTALAVIDDLGAVLVIALFYTGTLIWTNLIISFSIFGLMIILNRLKVRNLLPYITGSIFMWYFMHESGIHAAITGVLMAFAIPFGDGGLRSPSNIMQNILHKPVALLILPLFALVNTSIIIGNNWILSFGEASSIGILAGLIIGKPVGIIIFSYIAVTAGFCQLPEEVNWRLIFGAGLLAGIGFTMSIFITLLAFDNSDIINSSKLMILISSLIAGIVGYIWLRLSLQQNNEKQK